MPTTTAAKSRTRATTKKTTPKKEATPQPEVKEIIHSLENGYRIEVKLIEVNTASYQVISSADAIIAQGESNGQTLSYPGLKEKTVSATHQALMDAIAAYNETFPLKSGDVAVSRLLPHPYNSLMYDENNALEELERLMLLPDFKMDALVVNPKGHTLSGNSRLHVALKLNKQATVEGKSEPYPTLKVEIESYDSLEAELERIRRGNIYRQKTAADRKREAAIAARNLVLINASTSGSVSAEKVKQVAQETGMSQRNVENLVAVEKAQDNLPKSLAVKVEKIAQASPRSAAEIVRATPPKHLDIPEFEYKEAIADEIIDSPKRISSAAAQKQVNQRLSLEANAKKGSEFADKIAEAIAAGDNPADNRYTPDEFVKLAEDVMGAIYIDAFATVTNPSKVPAVKAYTILDDAFKQPFEKEVFANPPFSRAVESCALLDSWLRKKGGIEKLFLVVPFSVLGSESVHIMIDDFDLMICHPNGRVNFPAGEVLKAVEPDARENNVRDLTVILFYSQDEKDYDRLARSFPGWVGRRQKFGAEIDV